MHRQRGEEIPLHRKYTKKDYPEYDNFKAIEVSKVKDIPVDYDGVMGVPITFLRKYNPDQFEIIGHFRDVMWGRLPELKKRGAVNLSEPLINGDNRYARIFIKHKGV